MASPRKWLVLLLTLSMILITLAGCNNSDRKDPSQSESESESPSESVTDPTREPSVLDDVKFQNQVIYVLSWEASNLTEYEETLTETSTLLEKSVFDRCDQAESRLNIRTQWEVISKDNFIETADVTNRTSGKCDIIVNTSEHASPLMSRGVYSNLKQYEYLDFDHEGWAQSLLEDVTVRNKLYFSTGDISTNLVFMTSVVYFNKDLVEKLGINAKIAENYDAADLYELVRTGRWTLDKMISLCEDVYLDSDKSGMKGPGDRFGFTTYHNLFENFYYGGGYTTIMVDGDSFSVSPDFLNAEVVGDILDQANGLLYGQNGYIETNHDHACQSFSRGNVLFCMAPASHAWHTHSNTEDLNYSVLPIPKHSETQAKYACTQSLPYSVYCIASQAKEPEIGAAFLQALTEASYEITRPALFDKLMKGRYAEDPEDAEMWEYAVDANVFDVGRIFGNLFTFVEGNDPLTYSLFRDKIRAGNSNWSNALGSSAVQLTILANDLASEIVALPD